ncbi:hypothetical protein E1293_33085 [Actinomadura darangshiensis]|uniref:ATP/GTP-binding protein n=1 Tax=Actinomadura darangshiensis TaxID=705336 RepID=A0A4R5AKK3_9ACTN|nr:hypothetical protein [Actinomadura darangshiensis]TDD72160.1 hypothetical protein E1293_33085 [Actinomadura darangshiensis]
MSLHTPTRRRAAHAVITATALTIPLLSAFPAQAEGCNVVPGKGPKKVGSCNLVNRKPGTGGGGGTGAGGGGNGGPVAPPPPVGLTADEAQGFVPVGNTVIPQAAPVTTADLVARAQAATEFPVPVVHTAPADKTYVRLRTALWIDGFGDVETEPITEGAQTVQLVAAPKSVTWDLGEKTLVCDDGGSKNGKTCNYRYKRSSAAQPSGSYKITATITWDVSWTCEGADCDPNGGNLGPTTMTSEATPLLVSEIQTNTGQ